MVIASSEDVEVVASLSWHLEQSPSGESAGNGAWQSLQVCWLFITITLSTKGNPRSAVLILKMWGRVSDLPVRGVPHSAVGQRPPRLADPEAYPTLQPKTRTADPHLQLKQDRNELTKNVPTHAALHLGVVGCGAGPETNPMGRF